jgi:aminodeoxyfutalosine synthase
MPILSPILLDAVEEKILNKERLSAEEGLALLSLTDDDDIARVGRIANEQRKRVVGDVVHFASTLNINPTNLCELNCPFCSFYAKPGWEKAWFLTPEAIETKVRSFLSSGLTEIHIVGGLWRDCNLDYYRDVFTRIKNLNPKLHIKALTPVEYDFLAKMHGISIEEVFEKMMSWGLGSLPGGGAEILVEKIRKKIAPGKITSDEYLHVHGIAHKLGLHSNITMLFGHIETNEDIITHLIRVREQQDLTKGFKTFIPLKFGLENNALGKRKNQLKEKNVPLVYAVSRLMLDNITHQKVLWNYVGIEQALQLLDWGANDFSSTNLDEKIIAMASNDVKKLDLPTMTRLIQEKGRIPHLTHTGAI